MMNYNIPIMFHRRPSLRAAAWLLPATALLSVSLAQTAKRPLNHHDYDSWRAIASQHLSADGKFLAYSVFPEEGDGEVIIRNLVTGKDQHETVGARPQPQAGGDPEEGPPVARGVTLAFSADNRTLVFSSFPSKADTDKAKKEKKTPAQMPKDAMVIVDLASGKATRIDRVKRFQMPEKASGYLVYLREAPESAGGGAPARTEGAAPVADQQRGGRGGARGGNGGGARPEFGSDMVLRNLADSTERTFTDVVEFSIAEDGKQLVYAVSAKDSAKNGVFVTRPGSSDAPLALLDGKGKYAKLVWDEKQTQLAFLSDRDDAASKQPKWKLYQWDRQASAASLLASVDTPGFRKEFVISDKGALNFSRDGKRVYFACAPPQPEKKEAAADTPDDDKAVVDLWSYKDDYIQPIQKVRAARDRDRTFTAVYLIPEKKIVQVADTTLESTTPSESDWILGSDDREYRRSFDYEGSGITDLYVVDATTGTRKLVSKKGRAATWSPNGRYLLAFDGKDWSTISVPDGKTVNLTANLPVKFWNEEDDHPATPGSYGNAGWTKDGQSVLLYDHYDIWRISPDGSNAKNITAGYGRAHNLRFRYNPVEPNENPRERWIDPTKPVIFRAENLKTWESGLFRGSLDGGEPKQLIMSAKSFSPPIKAKDADVYLLTEQTFNEFPDLFTTDSTFKELRKVSDVNPQKSKLFWGTSEVLEFKNADGTPLTAALYKPENFDPHKKYPMMVYIYEKLTQNVNHFVNPAPGTSINASYYVSNGYLVLEPDIVYTTGYPGQSALKCVLPAIQAVVDKGIVDEKAIGIQGHSWGGYQIAYMVTQTNRFRAVAAGAPVVNMISAYDGIRWGTGLPRQFQYERTQSRIGGSIWQYPTRFIENSPIFWADRVQTPVMILQNDGDDAVPWYQGLEFFLALRRLGKEVYLFNYNGQPHGIRNRADQKDYAIRLQQYFDHYLKGAPAPDWMEKGVPYLERDHTALSTLGNGGQ